MAGIYGWQQNDRDIHKWGYTFDSLSSLLKRTGYTNIKKVEDSSVSGPLNLRVVAEKSNPLPQLLPDLDSQRPMWTYYNWIGFLKKISRKLKITGFLKYIIGFFRSVSKSFKKDYSSKGDRQVSPNIEGIRKDHTGRYRFSCNFIKKGDKVLDCACGIGYGSYMISGMTDAFEIIAVDKAVEAIEYARKYYYSSRIQYYEGDIFSLEFPDEHFDTIVSFETIEHVDGTGLLKLFYSKLKTGGLLITSTPNQDTQPYNIKEFPTHQRHYTPPEFADLLSSSGFEITGRYTQFNREKEDISSGWNGLFNIAIAKKT
jgi:ubiquinone/menaquinone biosynthesis C-methylase UbiE